MATLLDDRQVVNRAPLSALGNTANLSLDVIMGDINTYLANATFLPTASVLMTRDANANTQVNNLLEGFATTATAAGTTVLAVGSKAVQQFTGSTTQTVTLPNATTLVVGQSFTIVNRSTGNVTVQNTTPTTQQIMTANSQAVFTVTNIASSAGVWDVSYTVTGPATFLQTQVTTDATTTGSAATLLANDILFGVTRLTNASLLSISGIPAGASGQQITIENQTGAFITINNNDAGATAANRIFTGTGGPVSMSSNQTFELVYDTTVSRWMVVGGTGSGSGSGGKNYLTQIITSLSSGVPNTGNGNFEFGSTTGWSTAKATLTSLIPSAGTGGNPFSSSNGGTTTHGTFTFSTVSSGQLAGSYSGNMADSAAGEAGDLIISSAAFIDASDQGKVLPWSFSYKVSSGTINLSGTSANTFAVWIYDVSNNLWIQPVGTYNMVTNGAGICSGVFQSSSNGTRYQIAIIEINAPAAAFSLYVDDFVLGSSSSITLGSANVQTSTTQVLTASGTYTTPLGVQWIRVRMVGGGGGGGGTPSGHAGGAGGTTSFGPLLSCTGGGGGGAGQTNTNSGAGGTGTITSPAYGWTIPGSTGTGSAVTAQSIGGNGGNSPFGGGGGGGANTATGQSASANSGSGGGGSGSNGATSGQSGGGSAGGYLDAIIPSPAASYSYTIGTAGAAGSGGTINGGSGGTGLIVVDEFYSPSGIVGQAVGVNGTVAFNATASGVSVTGTNAVVTFATTVTDTNNSFNGTTTYTIPVSGVYNLACIGDAIPTTTTTGITILQILKNSVQIGPNFDTWVGTASQAYSISAVMNGIKCNAGDTIQISASQNTGASVTLTASFSVVLQGTGVQATQNRILSIPTVTPFTGSGSFTVPAGALYCRVILVGGGGGGAGGGTTSATGGAGNASSITGTGINVSCTGGTPGSQANTGVGGSASITTASLTLKNLTGGRGMMGTYQAANAQGYSAGQGGNGPLGGGGGNGFSPSASGGGAAQGGFAGSPNTGAGGGGAGQDGNTNALYAGSGGSAGGYWEGLIYNPIVGSVWTVTIAAASGGGGAGTDGQAGGGGASGYAEIWAYYQ